jgi:hypothetical protein
MKHPTLTALAWPSNHVIKEILQRVPDVDIIGLNSYASLKDSLRDKAKLYGERTDLIKNDQNCLGGYAFLWGRKTGAYPHLVQSDF